MVKFKIIFYFSLIFLFLSNALFSQCVIYEGSSQLTGSFLSTYDDDGPSVNESDIININGKLFFAADDAFSGSELWMIDDQTGEVVFVKDIYPGKIGSFPAQFSELNGLLLFTAKTDLGEELWKSDGTEAGTVLVSDIYPGSKGSNPRSLVVDQSTLYFSADDPLHNRELWKSDGTNTGTVLVKDIYPGTSESDPRWLELCDDQIFFSAKDGVNGEELWKSDGTESGTVMVKDINSGSSSSTPSQLTCVNSEIYFTGETDELGHELWKSDGTTSRTTLIADINPGPESSFPDKLVPFNNEIVFVASQPSVGTELWKSDGTMSGTQLIKDLTPGPEFLYIDNLRNIGSKIVFTNNSSELWATDGTEAFTQELGPLSVVGHLLQNFIAIDEQVYFSADDGELWVTNGFDSGTNKLTNLPGIPDSNVAGMTKMGDHIYFVADDGIKGFEMWKYNIVDGTSEIVKDINKVDRGTYYNDFYTVDEGIAFMLITNFLADKILFYNGTEVVNVIFDKDLVNIHRFLGVINDEYLFTGTDPIYGPELWKTDGTEAGTVLVKNIHPGTLGSKIKNSILFKDRIYFSANNGIVGDELWVSDGSPNGTLLLKDIQPGAEGSRPGDFVATPTKLFFSDGNNGLNVTDGTANGTINLLNSRVGNITAFGNQVIFTHNTVEFGDEIWISDGTIAGTHILKDIYAGFQGSSPSQLVAHDTGFYFRIIGSGNYELWKSDGTPSGTQLVSTDVGEDPVELTVFENDKLIFRSRTTNYVYEVWVSDGTNAGTHVVEGDYESIPDNFTSHGTQVYFIAKYNGVDAVWSTNGISAGAEIQWEQPECIPFYSSIFGLQELNDELYFVAPLRGSGSRVLYKLNCMETECNASQTNIWNGPTKGDWNKTPVYWEKGIPNYCDDVIIPTGNAVTIKKDNLAISHTLDVKKGAEFNTIISAELQVNN